MQKIIWSKKVISKILKVELAKRDLNYNELVEKLKNINVEMTAKDLRNRISKGIVPSLLLVQCLYAMGISNLYLDPIYFEQDIKPENTVKKEQLLIDNDIKKRKPKKGEAVKSEGALKNDQSADNK